MPRDNWNREQLIVALNLYWKIPYNKISGSSNTQIKEIAPIVGRTPAALAYKLMNFTSLDSEKQKIGNKGKSAASTSDREIWNRANAFKIYAILSEPHIHRSPIRDPLCCLILF